MKAVKWLPMLIGAALFIGACMPVQPMAGSTEMNATPTAATETMTDTMPMTDTATMTDTETMTATTETTGTMGMGTIVDIAAGDPDFSTLVTAVKAAGLVDVLADPKAEWTVFAPTNEAFAALPAGVLDTVLADKELLTRILTYHVVKGKITSDQVSTMMAPTMEMKAVGADLLGSELDVKVADGKVTVNGANVIKADIMASNGVIHVVDAVLLPPDVAATIGK